MNRKDLYQSFNAVDEDILVRSEKQKAKLGSIWLKWGTLAACFVVMLMTGTIMFLSNNGVQTSVGGVMRKYKNTSVSSTEETIVWPIESRCERNYNHIVRV